MARPFWSWAKTNENTEINNNSKIDKTEDEIIIEPIDNTKEIVVNGKTYKNVKIRHKKRRFELSNRLFYFLVNIYFPEYKVKNPDFSTAVPETNVPVIL